MALTSKAQLEANRKYKKKMMVNKTVSLYRVGDKDILDHLEELKSNNISFGGYVKQLIREDIEKGFDK